MTLPRTLILLARESSTRRARWRRPLLAAALTVGLATGPLGLPVETATAATGVPTDCADPFAEDFGTGGRAPLSEGQTSYDYPASAIIPPEGGYSLLPSTNRFASPTGVDHTPGDTAGRMMYVNATRAAGTLYGHSFTGLQTGEQYTFSAWLANMNVSSWTLLPNVGFRAVDPDTGAVLATFDTGALANTTAQQPAVWRRFGLTFTANQASVRLELVNNATSGASDVGNEVAIDDVSVSPACERGDAPDSYGTSTSLNGPVHGRGGPHLGAAVDYEGEGIPTSAADGDDTTGSADEDGVTFNPQLGYPNPTLRSGLDPITLDPVVNHVTVNASAPGFASMWVDWNGDGDFLDAGERVADATPVTAGDNDVTFSRTDNPPDSRVYVRVRYSTDAAAIHDPTGPAPDGEVEDYRVLAERLILPAACAPVSEPFYAMTFSTVTDEAGNGAAPTSGRYPAVSVVGGQLVDMLATTAPGGNTINANGFEVAGDDANFQLNAAGSAVAFTFTFVKAGTTTPIAMNSVWTVNDMDDTEQADIFSPLTGYAVTPGSLVAVTSTAGRVTFRGTQSGDGAPESRFQFWFQGLTRLDSTWRGFANSGFVMDGDGDVPLPQSCDDYGDAPESYATTAAVNGPHHHVTTSTLRLGANSEFDADGLPTPGADGDDTDRNDDEDGVSAPIVQTLGESTAVTVSATNALGIDATLAGWIDLDGNGTFDPAEREIVSVPAGSGTANYRLTFPTPTVRRTTYARFRLFPGTPADPQPTGPATAGEVEDYRVTTRALDVTKRSDATTDNKPGDVVHYTVTLTNSGSGDYTAADPAAVVDDLSAVLDDATFADDATADRGSAPTYTAPRLTWSGPLPAGQSVTLTYSVKLRGGGDGRVRNVAFAPPGADLGAPTPDCSGPSAAVPCAPTELLLPKLTLTKAADRTDLPEVGQPVTYQVTVTNTGPGDGTADHPATFTDDLSKVLDDGTLGGVSATVGTADLQGTRLSWTGVLASGQSATITYTLTYQGNGDRTLVNTACVPAEESRTLASACATVSLPGAPTSDPVSHPIAGPGFDLTLVKRVVGSAHVTPGGLVRYRLTVSNRGDRGAPGGIVVRDALPAGLELVSAHGHGWRCQAAKRSDVVSCRRPTGLRAGHRAAAIIVTAKVVAKPGRRVVNTAWVSVAGETASANNRGRAAVTVLPALPGTGFRSAAPAWRQLG